MIGALVAEPVALGDAGLVYYYYYKNKDTGNDMINHGAATAGVGSILFGVGTYALENAAAGSILYYAGAGLAATGVGLVIVGVGLLA
ncbi:hypothetical protein [Methanotorris igneus]|nr:hypothetical protein [Methanotorris igneus]